MSDNILNFKGKLANLYSKLADLSSDSVKNADEISALNAQIKEINSEINQIIEKEAKQKVEEAQKNGLIYSEKLGVFTTPEKEKERAYFEGLRKRSESGQPLTPIEQNAYAQWLDRCLTEPITGLQCYNDKQVEFLTGPVPVGRELEAFLAKNSNNLPQSFVHLMTPSESDPRHNHFVAITVAKNAAGKTEIHYLDSNGDPILPADRAIFARQFPGAEIVYRDGLGNRLSEEQAKNGVEQLRVQFDDSSCGAYASAICRVMQKSGMNEESIKAGLKEIQNTDVKDIRKSHSDALLYGKEISQNIPAVKSASEQGREDAIRQAQEIGSILKPARPSFVKMVQDQKVVNPEIHGAEIASARSKAIEASRTNNPGIRQQ